MPTSLAIKSFIFVSFNVILSHHGQLIIMPTSPAIKSFIPLFFFFWSKKIIFNSFFECIMLCHSCFWWSSGFFNGVFGELTGLFWGCLGLFFWVFQWLSMGFSMGLQRHFFGILDCVGFLVMFGWFLEAIFWVFDRLSCKGFGICWRPRIWLRLEERIDLLHSTYALDLDKCS